MGGLLKKKKVQISLSEEYLKTCLLSKTNEKYKYKPT